MAVNNIFLASADDVGDLFGDYLEGTSPCIGLAIGSKPLSPQARNALTSSLRAFGYGDDACMFAATRPVNTTVEGGDVPLDAQALFLLVEGLDPVCLICTDAETASLLGQAYHETLEPDCAGRVFGRPAVLFSHFENMLDSDDGKQSAWHLLKALPKR